MSCTLNVGTGRGMTRGNLLNNITNGLQARLDNQHPVTPGSDLVDALFGTVPQKHVHALLLTAVRKFGFRLRTAAPRPDS